MVPKSFRPLVANVIHHIYHLFRRQCNVFCASRMRCTLRRSERLPYSMLTPRYSSSLFFCHFTATKPQVASIIIEVHYSHSLVHFPNNTAGCTHLRFLTNLSYPHRTKSCRQCRTTGLMMSATGTRYVREG